MICPLSLSPVEANNGLFFLHSDHLGSASLTTNTSGVATARQLYDAWGNIRASASSGTMPTNIGYTGQRAETGLGSLYDYNARMYSPVLGRFLSADTIVPDGKNPQAFNRYAYTLNNPVKYTDPTGHDVGCPGQDLEYCGISSPTWIIDYYGWEDQVTALNLVERWLADHPDYNLYEDPEVWKVIQGPLFPNGMLVPRFKYGGLSNLYGYWRTSRGESTLLGEQVRQQEIAWLNAGLSSGLASTEQDENNASGAAAAAAAIAGVNFVAGANGKLVAIPTGWMGRLADNLKGLVFQKPGATGNADMLRIGDPDKYNKQGYVRYYNGAGQPLTVDGKTGSNSQTHIRLEYSGTVPVWEDDEWQ